MLRPVIALVLLAGVDVYDPCGVESATQILDVQPGPGESGLPLDASIWFRTRNLTAGALEVRLEDTVTHEPVGLREEAVLSWEPSEARGPREGAFRFTPSRPLEPGRAYALSWRDPLQRPQGHIIVIGSHRSGAPPPAPGLVETATVAAAVGCAYQSAVAIAAAHAGVFLLATVEGEARGFAHGTEVAAFVRGDPGAEVRGELVSIDIAGNRSVAAVPFTGLIPRLQRQLPWPYEPGGCSSVRGAGGELAMVLVIVGWVGRRGRAPDRERSRSDGTRRA